MERNSENYASQNPIGVFDSGLGGLSVWKEIREQLPHENLIYVADQANCPYGPQKSKSVISHSEKVVDFFLSQQCKIIVVACNTATAAAIEYLRENYEITFVGMEPATKLAAQQTRTGVIGILATEGTFRGKHFQKTKEKYAHHLETIIQVGEGLVELVENAQQESQQARATLEKCLVPMQKKGVDQLVLGCTHYPFLLPTIREILGEGINAIDPSPAVARQTKRLLSQAELLNTQQAPGKSLFYTTASPEKLTFFLQNVMQEKVTDQEIKLLRTKPDTGELVIQSM